MDFIFKILIAIGAYLIGDALTQEHTGKHIHEHLFEWWCRIRDRIIEYRRQHYGNYDIVIQAVEIADRIATGAKRATDKLLKAYAAEKIGGNSYNLNVKITEEVVSKAELFKQFPQLQTATNGEVVVLEM